MTKLRDSSALLSMALSDPSGTTDEDAGEAKTHKRKMEEKTGVAQRKRRANDRTSSSMPFHVGNQRTPTPKLYQMKMPVSSWCDDDENKESPDDDNNIENSGDHFCFGDYFEQQNEQTEPLFDCLDDVVSKFVDMESRADESRSASLDVMKCTAQTRSSTWPMYESPRSTNDTDVDDETPDKRSKSLPVLDLRRLSDSVDLLSLGIMNSGRSLSVGSSTGDPLL